MLWNQVNYIFILKNHVWPNFKLSSEKYHQHGPLHCKNLGIKKTTLTHWPQPTPYKSFPGTRGAQPSRNAALQKFCGPHLTAPPCTWHIHYIYSCTMYIVHPVQAVFFVAIMDSLHSQSNGACFEHILTLSCEFWSDYEIKDTSSWGPQVVSELADFDKHINEKLRFLNLFFHKAGDPPSLYKMAFILLGTGSTYWRTIYHIYPQSKTNQSQFQI